MTLRFIDGFDHYAIPSQLAMKYTAYNDSGGSSGITTMAGRRGGSTALLFRSSLDWISLTLDNQSTWIVGLAFYMFGNETSDFMRFFDIDGNTQCYVSITSGGIINLYRGATLIASSTNALAAGSWNFIEVRLTIADSGGVFEVRVNESVWVTFTGDTKQSSTQTTANRIMFYSRSSDCGLDDLYICDGAGSINNTYLGDSRIDTVRPTGAGTYTEFGHQGSSSNWDNVDDTTVDSDSSYNYSNTVGQRDTFDCSNLPVITGSIYGIQVNMVARKDDAGGRTVRSLTRLASTDYEGSSQNIGTDYRDYRQIIEQNPNTTAAWTESDINGAEFGYKVQA